ncbi:TIGR02594 family protein [Rhizobiaceae bacterium n13]|uniref:N-acetylmuramoyl-L-alanine amidase n=1 Tax=Ferirhizobium litorale TaxID=2927786 RepID=A0AAE3Q966_9HYPH|nr:TIGR02594 family protein [Fererhizobium litorale]MDI7860455.1 TIGR02594 family protein [Fererhizobium litorale]MDI7920590.1 TIGR02594 family protein [Fererhizobium litorale]
MHEIIDIPWDVGPYATRLADAGVKSVIRYYNHRNSSRLPSKCLTERELEALHAADLSVAVVFQQRGGADGNISDLNSANGVRDAERALELAAKLNQPHGSAIYFAVDWDYFRTSELRQIEPYFEEVRRLLGNDYKLGVYGSGTVGTHFQGLGLADYIWLAGALGWSGTRRALERGNWTLFQKYMAVRFPFADIHYDGNIFNPAFASFGQFDRAAALDSPKGEGSAALFRVIARSGLNLRAGPSDTYRIIQSYPLDTIVTGRGREGEWVKVDIEGDGDADGYMHRTFLEPVSGGLSQELPAARKPVDVARAEMELGVREIPGRPNNPRIVMYHATTTGGSAPDETAWCSSFVNYCVEQAGLTGTDSKWARSWHDEEWGRDKTANPEDGDIVVFRRSNSNTEGGHVAFFVDEDANSILCLGGNQGNRVSLMRYPKNGRLGPFNYKLLSIRRA